MTALPDAIGSIAGTTLGEKIAGRNADLSKAEAKKQDAKANLVGQQVATIGDQAEAAVSAGWGNPAIPSQRRIKGVDVSIHGLAGGGLDGRALRSRRRR